MSKLPEIQANMMIAEALFIELMHILVDEGILTEAKALARYETAKKKYIGWT